MPMDSLPLAFVAKKLVALLVLPPAGPLLLIGLGLAFRRLRAAAWAGWLYALAVSMPITVGWLAAALETAPPAAPERVATTEAIVILGAGTREHAPEYGGPTVNALALERLRLGALLARRSGLPVLVTGGSVDGRPAEAVMMRGILEDEFGVPVRWTEAASLDTRGNAVESARTLRAAGVRRITLVTHAAHMPRARAAFEAAGLAVVPAPTAWLSNPDPAVMASDFVPNARSAFAGWFAVHEWVGGLVYRLGERPAAGERSARDAH